MFIGRIVVGCSSTLKTYDSGGGGGGAGSGNCRGGLDMKYWVKFPVFKAKEISCEESR